MGEVPSRSRADQDSSYDTIIANRKITYVFFLCLQHEICIFYAPNVRMDPRSLANLPTMCSFLFAQRSSTVYNNYRETLIKPEIQLRRISGGGICGASPRIPALIYE